MPFGVRPKGRTGFTPPQIHHSQFTVVACNCIVDFLLLRNVSCPGNAFARKGNSVHGPVNARVASPRDCRAPYVKCDDEHGIHYQDDRRSTVKVSRFPPPPQPVAPTILRRCLSYFCTWLPWSNVRDDGIRCDVTVHSFPSLWNSLSCLNFPAFKRRNLL